jgi:hypothetical protein
MSHLLLTARGSDRKPPFHARIRGRISRRLAAGEARPLCDTMVSDTGFNTFLQNDKRRQA